MSKTRFFGNLIKTNPTLPTANSSSAYGTATGIWTLEEAGAFRAAGDWPIPGSVAGAPTITGVTAGNAQVAVAFNANADAGSFTVSSFTALASSGESASGSSSPITVTGLTNGNAVTFTVTATNAAGASSASSASSSVTPTNPARGVFFGGIVSSYYDTIQYITIPSTGNATDFGDLSVASYQNAACASSTRGVCAIGYDVNDNAPLTIEYITIANTGNTTDFGDLLRLGARFTGFSNSTRGVFSGGNLKPSLNYARTNVQEYITIASTGNATDFGTMSEVREFPGGTASSTRGIIGGGLNNFSQRVDSISYITIASANSGGDFGDLTQGRDRLAAGGSSTRGVFGGGYYDGASQETIDYVTIASLGNATDFGNLAQEKRQHASASDQTRTTFAGGYNAETNAAYVNSIEYITTASTGNGSDFGDLLTTNNQFSGTSNGHGGL